MINNSDFNSALALFKSLYKSKKGDIYTIIERFILAGVRSKNYVTVTVESINSMLKEQFDIDVPRSIIVHCINNQNVFKYRKGEYTVEYDSQQEIDNLIAELRDIDEKNEKIVTELYQYIERKNLVELNEKERNDIRTLFFDIVKDREKEYSHKYFLDITQYIIEHENDESFNTALDDIKEGAIIYQGIRYSEQANQDTWKTDTVLFLDMEYLFNSYGLNGIIYKEYFYDFYKLVKEINDGSPSKYGSPRIKLMYFSRTKNNIDNFFAAAENIKEHKIPLVDNREAMVQIVNKCIDAIDVVKFKTKFFNHLRSLGIEEYDTDKIDIIKYKDWIFENKELLQKLEKKFQDSNEDDLHEAILFSDYINILRQGKNYQSLDKCKYMFLSASDLANRVSIFLRENDGNLRSRVITRMDVFTEHMWFKLKKGIVDSKSIATFKVLYRVKSIVSSLLNESISKSYKQVVESEDEDIETKKRFYAEIRMRPRTPERINSQNVNGEMEFISSDFSIEHYKEEQETLRNKANEADVKDRELKLATQQKEQVIAENKRLKEQIQKTKYEQLKKKRQIAQSKFAVENFLYMYYRYIIGTIMIVVFGGWWYYDVSSLSSCMGVCGGVVGIAVLVSTFLENVRQKVEYFRRRRYRSYISKELQRQ